MGHPLNRPDLAEQLPGVIAYLELLTERTKFEQTVLDHYTHRGVVFDRQVEIMLLRMNSSRVQARLREVTE